MVAGLHFLFLGMKIAAGNYREENINSEMRKFLVLALSFAIMATSAFAQGKKKYSDHYYKRTAQFEQERPITPNDIVMLGDSLTEGGDWASYFADWLPEGVSVVNRGIVGDDAPGIYDRLHQILPGNPKKI